MYAPVEALPVEGDFVIRNRFHSIVRVLAIGILWMQQVLCIALKGAGHVAEDMGLKN